VIVTDQLAIDGNVLTGALALHRLLFDVASSTTTRRLVDARFTKRTISQPTLHTVWCSVL